MRRPSATLTALMLSASLALAGCESSEERAQRHFETAMELLAEGDVQRAYVEFRNVFKLNPRHKEARMEYAMARLEAGDKSEAYGQLLRLVEQYPDTTEARILLAEMAIQTRNWDEAKRHGKAAVEMAPDDPRVRVIETALAYAEASRQEDNAAREEQAEIARTEMESAPDNFIARSIVIDYLATNGRLEEALPVIDEGLAQHPEDYNLHQIKLQTQVQAGKMDLVGDTLRTMVETFPDDEEARRLLITWYIQQGDMEGAENFLRELAERPDADTGAHMAVIQFLRRTKGDDAAREEVQRLIETQDDPTVFIAVLASMDFDAGDRDRAIAALEQRVDGVETPTAESNDAKFLLVRMLASTGNHVGARARIEEILDNDASHVQALKARAGLRIDDDEPGEAIIDLRTALSQAPEDPEIMTLMARAHERAGDRALAGERYALAVELSNRAPEESMRYAAFLIAEDRPEAAGAVLSEALNEAPRNVDLIKMAAGLHLRNRDWNEVQRAIWKLRKEDTDEAIAVANSLEAEMLLMQDRLDESVTFLENLSNSSDDIGALAALVQTQLRAGNTEAAQQQIEERLAETPDDPALRFLRAGLHVVSGERDQAETTYRDLLKDHPGNNAVIRALFSILRADNRTEDALALLDEQIELAPDALNVHLFKAEMLERSRDFEGAIAIYEDIYSRNSNNIIVANNLASLIASHRDDAESLERAYVVARRLRGSDIPQLQDTYGWIAFRRGDLDEALSHLEPAAKGLPGDPLVQYHLARTYLELERFEEARGILERAIEISGDTPLPQIKHARELLENLPAPEASGSTE
ncbi:Uncharacterized conserved protein HemY, contains two TPR repeats [Roseovarius pacificus]|uniref:Uncharacterized conserved protein HemY, contains two TPR repeats n=1 Tax=Roseovarius pacificus TaxID=337701 RepID=A0A1M7HMU0_9RHOB|nr:tetratricopeptide repeat protein [Roseovarius pacificus]GGO60626.1 hypothetical protein GCM10011315_35490 [Roseovarius pacificus]SHM29871.1 Uncharacterized conserved protein HemY, contains two TPR repeats [Roseovarius pacificus]